MQKIFSQEIRFKNDNGNNFPDWKEKKLSEILTYTSSDISYNSLPNCNGNYLLFGATGCITKINFYEKENDYIAIVKDGAGVGKTFLCPAKSSVLGTLSYLENTKNSILKFCYYYLQAINIKKYIKGSTIPHIYYKDYKNEKINLPIIQEQQKIADFLSSVDELIEKQQQKIEQLKQHKKGLLQGLFPNIQLG